jgi:alpha-L-fucosidase
MPPAQGWYLPTWESLSQHEVPAWYRDGKFGIFIHWGVYSVPGFANEWYPRNMYVPGSREFAHHVETYGPQARFGYKDFIPRFTAAKFDPDAWADLFARAGARYVVPVAEHHDGFAMYASALSEWTAEKLGPQRDIVGELGRAVRARGMVLGVSSHRAEHWWFFDGGRKFDSDVNDPRYQDFYGPAAPQDSQPSEAYLNDWLVRCQELVDRYQPQLVWFDWWIEQPAFEPYLRRFAAHYYNRGQEWGRGVAINYKHQAFPEGTAVFDVERGQLTDLRPSFWQTDTAVGKNSWGYIRDQEYKSATSIIHDLCDIVSKNGALLLNIGPRPDGLIPEPEVGILEAIGGWLLMNGEAVYGTRPWKVFGEGPTEIVGGSFNDTKRSNFTSEDIRFTTKGDVLYAIVLGRPKGEVAIQSLGANLRLYNQPIGRVRLLGSDEALPFRREAGTLRVSLPAQLPTEHASALAIEG